MDAPYQQLDQSSTLGFEQALNEILVIAVREPAITSFDAQHYVGAMIAAALGRKIYDTRRRGANCSSSRVELILLQHCLGWERVLTSIVNQAARQSFGQRAVRVKFDEKHRAARTMA